MNRFQFYYDSSDDESSVGEKDHCASPMLKVDSSSKTNSSVRNITNGSPRGVDEPFMKLGGNDMNHLNSNHLNLDVETTSLGLDNANKPEELAIERPCVQFGKPYTYKVWFEKYIYPKLVKFVNSDTSSIQFILQDSVNEFLCDGGIFRDDKGDFVSSSIVIALDNTNLSRRSSKEYKRLMNAAMHAFDQIYTMNKKKIISVEEDKPAPTISKSTTKGTRVKDTRSFNKTSKSTHSASKTTPKSKVASVHSIKTFDSTVKETVSASSKKKTNTKKMKPSSKRLDLSKNDAKSNKKGCSKKVESDVSTSKQNAKSKVPTSKQNAKSKSSSAVSSAKTSNLKKRKGMDETTAPKAKKAKQTSKIKEKEEASKGAQKLKTTRKNTSRKQPSKTKTKSIASKPKSKTKSSATRMNGKSSTRNKDVEKETVPQEISISSEELPLQDDGNDFSVDFDNTSLVTQEPSFDNRCASQSVDSICIYGASSKVSLVSDIHVFDSAISRFVNVSKPEMYTCMLDRVTNHFKCPVCLDIMTDIYSVPNCLHKICYKCADNSIRKCYHRCPECRISVPTKRILRNDERYEQLKTQIFGEGGLIEKIGRNNQAQNDRLRKSMTRYFLCSLCKSLPKKTCVVPECMHRFCSDCLDTDCDSCPECEIQITSKLPIREDSNFDELRHLIISDGGILD